MNCCPLTEADEVAKLYSARYPIAAKEHCCKECRKPIPKGSKHLLVKMLFDGSWISARTCPLCEEIGKHFSCGRSRIIGQLWDDLQDNFFLDMRAGGPCMEGLSPEAKAFLFEQRTEWLFRGTEA